jgi:uncharacterized protein
MGIARAAIFSIAIALLALFTPARAQGLQPVPELTARVIDETNTLDAIQRKGLEDKLAAFEQSKGTQVAFLIVATTQPEDIAAYANRVGNAWKIGRKEVGDGVLLVVAKNDRKVRIEVAKTLEGAIPDLAAQRIIDEAITPRFREGDFAGGLQGAADRIIALASGEQLPAPKPSAREHVNSGFDWFDLAIFLFFAVPIGGAVLRGIFGRKLGALVTGAGVGAIALFVTASLVVAVVAAFVALAFSLFSSGFGGAPRRSSRGGWGGGPWIGTGGGWGSGSSGGSWGGGGGGFSSGGGGDFGGGGASGDW